MGRWISSKRIRQSWIIRRDFVQRSIVYPLLIVFDGLRIFAINSTEGLHFVNTLDSTLRFGKFEDKNNSSFFPSITHYLFPQPNGLRDFWGIRLKRKENVGYSIDAALCPFCRYHQCNILRILYAKQIFLGALKFVLWLSAHHKSELKVRKFSFSFGGSNQKHARITKWIFKNTHIMIVRLKREWKNVEVFFVHYTHKKRVGIMY